MAARRTKMQITCPACGHRFELEGSIAEHLEQQWRLRERAVLRKEVNSEVDEKARAKAARIAATQVRESQEQVKDREKTIAALRSQLTRIQKRMPSGRAQELGVLRQQTLADLLSNRFPSDEITVIPRGVSGADVVEIVIGDGGKACGSILWESKRAANWAKSWVSKLAADQRRGGHTVGVIASDVLPDDDKVLMQVGSVWACKLDAAADLANLLREGIIQSARARAASARRGDLKGKVYDYVTSPEFAEHISSVVRIAMLLREEVEAERRAFTARWKERENFATAIVEDLATMYADLRGIGASLPAVKHFQLEHGRLALPPSTEM